jgi:hypothetical protein
MIVAAAMAMGSAFAHSDKPKPDESKDAKGGHKKGDHKEKGHGHDKKH